MSGTPGSQGYPGQIGLSGTTSDFNKNVSVIQQILGRISTMKLAQVVAVTPANAGGNMGADVVAGFVDVQLLVNQIDGLGTKTPHGVVHNLPYFRVQGGTNAVIIDPVINDIGLVIVADRDISSVKVNRAQANPGSYRRFDAADGVYLGGILNAAPVQYITFVPGGINIVDKNGNIISMQQGMILATTDLFKFSDDVEIVGNLKVDGNINITGNLVCGGTGQFTGDCTAPNIA